MKGRMLTLEWLEDRRVMAADFSGNGTVDAPDLDIWRTGFGTVNTATQSTGDSDADMDVDGADFLAWQRELEQSTAPPRAPEVVNARALSSTSGEVTWSASPTATSYAVARRQPDTETAFTIIAPNVTGTSYIDSGLAPDTLYQYVVIARRNPDSVPSKPGELITTGGNLTAYRPQWVQIFDAPSGGPKYERLTRWAVLEGQEDSSTVGPGIRINGDDDNRNGIDDYADTGTAIPQENDLIEVKIDRVPSAGDLSLSFGGRLRVFQNHDRTQQIMSGELIDFDNDTATVFVEWASNTHGTEFLTLVDAAQAPLDSVRFHSFRSIVIVFGGNTQNPYDTDGDGRMGDRVEGLLSPEGNREGFFDLATELYITGWDVMAFDEEEYVEGSPETTIAYEEVVNALDERFVGAAFNGGFSFIGYSQGGGAIHDIIEAVYNRDTNPGPEDVTSFAVYLDAVDHNLPDDQAAPETRRPSAVAFMLNLYQTIDVPRGNALDDQIGIGLEEDDASEPGGLFDLDTVHQLIDDDLLIRQLIRQRLLEVLDNR